MFFSVNHHLTAYMFEGIIRVNLEETDGAQVINVCSVCFLWNHDIYGALPS
jgi:hypothetical protein